MEPPPGCLESPFGAAPPAHLLEGNILVGVGAHSALIPGHLLSLETARQPGTWRESAVRFPAQEVWILRAGQSLWSGGAWESANTGGHRELINWASPGKFGRSTPAHGLSSSKPILGRTTPLLPQTHGDEGLGGCGVRRGGSRECPTQAAKPLQRRSATQGAGLQPRAPAQLHRPGPGPVPLGRSRLYKDGSGGSGTPVPAHLRAAQPPLASRQVRRRRLPSRP